MTKKQKIEGVRVLSTKIYYAALGATCNNSTSDKTETFEDIRKMASKIECLIEHIQAT